MEGKHRYAESLEQFIHGNLPMTHFTRDLLLSDDLQHDVSQLIKEIESHDWKENPNLSALHDLAKMVEAELVFNFPVEEPLSANLFPYVCFANLLTTGGKSFPKNSQRAKELLEYIVSVAPDYPFAHCSLGTLFLEGGEGVPRDFRLSVEHYQEAVHLDPDYSFALANMGEILREGGYGVEPDHTAAYHYLQRACHADPKSSHALGSLGALLKKSDPVRAKSILFKAHEVDPNDTFVLICLADLLLTCPIERDQKRAFELLLQAEKLQPTNVSTLNRIAEILVAGVPGVPKDIIQARIVLEKAIELPPQNPHTLVYLAELYLLNPVNDQRAKALVERALLLQPEYPYGLAVLGEILRTGSHEVPQDRPRAYALLNRAVELEPNFAFALASLGEILWTHAAGVPRDPKRAVECLQKALLQNRNYAFALNWLGEILRAGDATVSKDAVRAYAILEHSLKIDPNQPFALAGFASIILHHNEYKHETKRAYECLLRAIELDSRNPFSLIEMAMLLKFGGQDVQMDQVRALDYFYKTLELTPDNIFVLSHIAELHFRNEKLKDYAKAYELLKKACSFEPQASYPYALLSELILISGLDDKNSALGLLEKALAFDPKHVPSLFHLATLLKESDPLRSYRLIEQALQVDPNNADLCKMQLELLKDGIMPSEDDRQARLFLDAALHDIQDPFLLYDSRTP